MSEFWKSKCRCGVLYRPFEDGRPVVAVVCSCGHVNIMHDINEKSQRTFKNTREDERLAARIKASSPSRGIHFVKTSEDYKPGSVIYFRDELTSVGRVLHDATVSDLRSWRRYRDPRPCWTTAAEYDHLCASGKIKIPRTLKRK